MNANKRATPTAWADPDDAPELDDVFFDRADEFQGETLVRRGRPPAAEKKVLLSVRYSAEVVRYFKATGDGWQSRMDAVLRDYITQHQATH